ncbi:MAG: UvrD-helicase domain-containing protein [Flavonifractor plautii]
MERLWPGEEGWTSTASWSLPTPGCCRRAGAIVEELSARLAERPTDAHLRRPLVYKAQISTVHAFCAQLLRECGHLLELDPDFRLCDEGEAGILMLRALNDVLDRHYEDIAEGSDFARLVDTMSAGRDDSRLMQIVLDIRGRVQAHPNPAAWLDGQERAFPWRGWRPGETPGAACCWTTPGGRGPTGGQIARALSCALRRSGRQLRPQPLRHPGGLDAVRPRQGRDAARAAAHPFPRRGEEDCGLDGRSR